MATKQRQDLSTGWKWRLANSNGVAKAEEIASIKDWNPVTAFPSVIHMELLANGTIPDFNVAENERLVQWVGAVDWEYSLTFVTPDGHGKEGVSTNLVFEGLDTFVTVTLNGKEILKADNMFLPHRLDVGAHLNPAKQDNNLSIVFESAMKKGTEYEGKFGVKKEMFRDRRRHLLRKAQCHWGWDWGPVILTAGPWLPVYLDTYTARIDHVHVTSELAEDHSSATISVDVQAVGSPAKQVKICIIDAKNAGGADSKSNTVLVPLKELSKAGSGTISVQSPKLWWPNGQGDQHLYKAVVTLLDSTSNVLDESRTQFGVRKVKIIERPLDNAPGTTFMFNVNGRDIFSQGGDWIPADNLIPRIGRERYFDWIRLARYNHVNMIRVWGGGIYETEDFFDACDEFGILVWHDYALACGNWPMEQEFIDSVKLEAEAQTLRLRNRASLALLCGGNEDFLARDWFKEEYDFSDHTGPFEDKPFPQRKFFLQLLPEIAERLAPEIDYWPSSPWGREGKDSFCPTSGDIHQWNVWHADQRSYQDYKELSGRFVSEFGMHGFPVMRTLEGFAPNPAERFPQSKTIDCHNKAHGAETRIARYMSENFRYDMRMENYVYCSHLMQSEAYGYALRDWKRKFGGKGKEECSGAIIWQLNDIYPCTSWAYIDYYLRPKPAFYTIRRTFAPIYIGIERTPRSRWIDEDHPRESEKPSFEVFAHNSNFPEIGCTLKLRAYDFLVGKWVPLEWDSKQVVLAAGHNTELGKINPHSSWTEQSLIILEASLIDNSSGTTLARYINWPEPYRYLQWPEDTAVKVSVEAGDAEFENKVTVTANQPIKGLWIEPIYNGSETIDSKEPLWDDNMIDLMPGQSITVGVSGLKGRPVHTRFLGDWELPSSEK